MGIREVILTDTVGFIRDLPADLVTAFKATLEELTHADILLHIVDIAASGFEDRIAAVERVLDDLDLQHKKCIIVFNKSELVEDRELLANLCREHEAEAVSALDRRSLHPLATRLGETLSPR